MSISEIDKEFHMKTAIDFFKGNASSYLLPSSQIASAYSEILQNDVQPNPENAHPLHYGTDSGNLRIRENVIKWSNGKFRRDVSDPSTINLTAGASYGAANILTSCTRPDITKHVFAVSPTYFLINYSFADAGFAGNITAIRETPGEQYDVDIAKLEAALSSLDQQFGLEAVSSEINVLNDPTGRGPRKYYRYVMYLVPTFSNPGAATYSLKTRQKLLEVARRHDMLLLCDDVYDFLAYNRQCHVPKICHLDHDTLPTGFRYGNTVSNCSFSKIIAPGLRVGYQETATLYLATQLATTGANISGGTPGQLSTFVVDHFITTGELDKSIELLATTFRSRSKVMNMAINKYLPMKHVKHYGGEGGYFHWVQIEHPNVDVGRTVEAVYQKYGVRIPNGNHFEVKGDPMNWGECAVRLCITLTTEEEIEDGIKKWGAVIKEMYPYLY